MRHDFVEAVVGSFNRSFQPLFYGFALELKCVSEQLNFGVCLATKLRLFLFRLPTGLAERSISLGDGSFFTESSFFGFALEFSL